MLLQISLMYLTVFIAQSTKYYNSFYIICVYIFKLEQLKYIRPYWNRSLLPSCEGGMNMVTTKIT